MIYNEYRQCLLRFADAIVPVWMPHYGAIVGVAIDLDEDGKLWEVVEVQQSIALTHQQMETRVKYDPSIRWVPVWIDDGKRIDPLTKKEIPWKPAST